MIPNKCIKLCAYCERVVDTRYGMFVDNKAFHTSCKREYDMFIKALHGNKE
jgi:hypothetical protein